MGGENIFQFQVATRWLPTLLPSTSAPEVARKAARGRGWAKLTRATSVPSPRGARRQEKEAKPQLSPRSSSLILRLFIHPSPFPVVSRFSSIQVASAISSPSQAIPLLAGLNLVFDLPISLQQAVHSLFLVLRSVEITFSNRRLTDRFYHLTRL